MSEPPTLNELAIRPFKPVAYYHRGMDELHVYLRDCATVEDWDKSGITLVRDFDNALVGVHVAGFSRMAAWDIVNAVIDTHFPAWFRFLYHRIRKHRERELLRDMKAAGFPFA